MFRGHIAMSHIRPLTGFVVCWRDGLAVHSRWSLKVAADAVAEVCNRCGVGSALIVMPVELTQKPRRRVPAGGFIDQHGNNVITHWTEE
jgi:hypothetical protein